MDKLRKPVLIIFGSALGYALAFSLLIAATLEPVHMLFWLISCPIPFMILGAVVSLKIGTWAFKYTDNSKYKNASRILAFAVCLVTLIVPFTISLAWASISYHRSEEDTDAALIAGFPNRKATLNGYRLLMIHARGARDTKVDLPTDIFTSSNENAICFPFEGKTWKGYAYLKRPPPDPVSTLDYTAFYPEGLYFYRHIEGHWYIYYYDSGEDDSD